MRNTFQISSAFFLSLIGKIPLFNRLNFSTTPYNNEQIYELTRQMYNCKSAFKTSKFYLKINCNYIYSRMTIYKLLFVRTQRQALLAMMRYVKKSFKIKNFSMKLYLVKLPTLIGQTSHNGPAKFYNYQEL